MKYTLQIPLFTGLLFFNVCSACYPQNEIIEFVGNEVYIPARLGSIKLYKDAHGFHVINNNKICDVQSCFCDPLLRKMSHEQLKKFLGRDKPTMLTLSPDECAYINIDNMIEVTGAEKERILNQLFSYGYISVNQMDDGEYILRIKHRLLGGGFWRILKWAGMGAIGCASVAAGGAEILEATGYHVSMGPVLIIHSVLGAIGGGMIAILMGRSSAGQQQEDNSATVTSEVLSAEDGVAAPLIESNSADQQQANNPAAYGTYPAPDVATIPLIQSADQLQNNPAINSTDPTPDADVATIRLLRVSRCY